MKGLRHLKPSRIKKEYYLTDVVSFLAGQKARLGALKLSDGLEILGVNNRVELAQVGQILRSRILRRLMLAGVTVMPRPKDRGNV